VLSSRSTQTGTLTVAILFESDARVRMPVTGMGVRWSSRSITGYRKDIALRVRFRSRVCHHAEVGSGEVHVVCSSVVGATPATSKVCVRLASVWITCNEKKRMPVDGFKGMCRSRNDARHSLHAAEQTCSKGWQLWGPSCNCIDHHCRNPQQRSLTLA